MSRMMDADKFLSWLSEVEGEIRKEKMKECQPDRYDDGLMAATGTIREYVEKNQKHLEDIVNQKERLMNFLINVLVIIGRKPLRLLSEVE